MQGIFINRRLLNSPKNFQLGITPYLNSIKDHIEKELELDISEHFTDEEISQLILSVCRFNEFEVLERGGLLNIENLLAWTRNRLTPNIVSLSISEEDIIRLLLFSIEMTYRMFLGGTRATVTAKGFRERRRTFEAVMVDQFTGKFGEVAVKKLLENRFGVQIELDWEISPEIDRYASDIVNANKNVSIKTVQSLAAVWAEADRARDYGLWVKVALPLHPVLQFFIEVCGFSSLLNFAKQKIPLGNSQFKEYIEALQHRVKDYKCGEFKTKFTGFVCGYFRTSDYEPVGMGVKLAYLGQVREERYLVPVNELKYTEEDWRIFLSDIGVLFKVD